MGKAVAINVGVNNDEEWGRFRGPIFSDGSFEFIHIPWHEKKYGVIDPPPKKYKDMPYSLYVPKRLHENFVLQSPNFKIKTYASTTDAPANKPIWRLQRGDFLLFYSTLDFKGDEETKEDWINSYWGAYVVGYFKIDRIWESIHYVLNDESAIEAFADYDWFKILISTDPHDWAPWVKGIEEESGLLKKAIPLSRPKPEDPQRWSDDARHFFTTTKRKLLGDKVVFQTVLLCEGNLLDELVSRCVLRDNCI
jgi:hypothetical protein